MDGEAVETVPGALQAYLADRDVACPHCKYNLRGVTATVCPECGRDLELCLRENHPLALRRGLLALALLWLLAIGGVQAARCGRDVYQTAGRSQWFQTLSTIRSRTTPITLATVPTVSSGTVTVTGPTSAAAVPATGRSDGTTNNSTTTYTMSGAPAAGGGARGPIILQRGGATTITSGGTVRIITPGTMTVTPTLAWTNVSPVQWVRLGAWSVAAGLGLVGALLLLAYRRRTPTARAMRIMMTAAWAGFAIAAGIEIHTLVAEVI